VTDATNYDILGGQQALYHLGFGLDNRIEEAWIRPGWSAGGGRRELIPMAFVAATTIASLPMVFGCGTFVDILSYSFALLEEYLAFMGSVEDQQNMIPKDVFVHHPKDLIPLWYDPLELTWQCENIILSLVPTTLVLPDSPSALAQPIVWRLPDARIILVEIFGGIGIGLAVLLEVGLMVRRFVYVDNSQVCTRVARHHLHHLMLLYPQQLHPIVIRGCFSRLPHDVTIISEADLRYLGLVDMVIAG
jgi:hypothetical protein